MDVHLTGVPANANVTLQRVDREHGNVVPRWAAMGKPLNPTPTQAEQLNRETALPAPQQTTLHNGVLHLSLTQNALVLIRIEISGH